MVSLKLSVVLLAALRATSVFAQAADNGLPVEDLTATLEDAVLGEQPLRPREVPDGLKVNVRTSFPDTTDVFGGVKLVNGHATRAVLDITNHEPADVTLVLVGGALLTPLGVPGAPDPPVGVRNLTAHRFGLTIPPGETEVVNYAFTTELHPQDLTLNLAVIMQNSNNQVFSLHVFNGTVSVVEAPVSIFDPQIIFLYLFLAAAFGGVIYYLFQTWRQVLFPPKRREGERTRRSAQPAKRVTSPAPGKIGEDGAAATSTGSKAYDESWIPQEHLRKPEARRVGSGRPKSRAA